jgi:hypothetical protein
MLFGFFRVIQFLFSCVPIKCSLQKCLCRVHDWLGFSVTKYIFISLWCRNVWLAGDFARDHAALISHILEPFNLN